MFVWNCFAKAAMTRTRASHHSINKKVSEKSYIVRKFSKARLKFDVVIVQTKTEVVQSMQIVQSEPKTN